MVNPSDSNCWTAFTFYSRPITHSLTHSLVFTSVKHPQIITYQLLTVHRCNNCFIKFVGCQCLQFITTNKKLRCSVTTTFIPSFFAGVAYHEVTVCTLLTSCIGSEYNYTCLCVSFSLLVMECH